MIVQMLLQGKQQKKTLSSRAPAAEAEATIRITTKTIAAANSNQKGNKSIDQKNENKFITKEKAKKETKKEKKSASELSILEFFHALTL